MHLFDSLLLLLLSLLVKLVATNNSEIETAGTEPQDERLRLQLMIFHSLPVGTDWAIPV